MQEFGGSPASLRLLTSTSNIALANPEQQILDAMVEGWRSQQRSRGLREQTIQNRLATVTRFRDFVDKPPWKWTVADVDEFTADSMGRVRALSTLRNNHGSIHGFCEYLTSPLYDWMEICEREFAEIPSQVCLPWNTVAHRFEFEGDGKRRPLAYDEVERLFDTADARVETLVGSGRKGALGALRDAQLLKTVYAFGLRRTEAVMLDTVDLHYNAKMRQWGRYGAIHVRWAKAAGGGPPRRRTVLLVPEFDWWVPGMEQWVEQARDRFAPGSDLDALWVTTPHPTVGRLSRPAVRGAAGRGRLVKGPDSAQPPAFVRDAPARVRLRRPIRPGAGRAHACFDDLDLRLRQLGLQEPGTRGRIEGPHRRRS